MAVFWDFMHLFFVHRSRNGVFHRVFYQNDIKLPLALITVSDLLYSFVCYVLLFLLRGRFQFGFYFKSVILPEIVYTIFVTVFLYPVILLLNRTPDDADKGVTTGLLKELKKVCSIWSHPDCCCFLSSLLQWQQY